MPRIRLRFSLATLLLSATIGCLSVALWATYQELARTRRQVAQLETQMEEYRNELGYVTISDPDKVHAIRVRMPGSFDWRWRVYAPKDRRCWLCYQVGDISADGFSGGPGGSSGLPPGESTVYARVTRDLDGKLVFRVGVLGRGHATIGMEGERADWVKGGRAWESIGVGNAKTDSVEPGGRLVLLRQRASKREEQKHEDGTVTWHHREIDGPADGFLIWISDPGKGDPEGDGSPRRDKPSQ